MKRIHKEEGFSLVEMVVAMSILSIFIPIMASMMLAATTANNTSKTTAQNAVSSSSIVSVLENDVKRSGNFWSYYSSNGNVHTIRMARADGVCVAWKVYGNKMQRIETDGTKLKATWPNIDWNKAINYSENAKPVGTEAAFTWVEGTRNEGPLNYKIQLGDKTSTIILEGTVESEIAVNGKGYCW